MTVKQKIIIVGAGIAGLSAAVKLRQHGFNPIILEARDRTGGRIYTNHRMGVPFGLGASWIHGDQNNPMSILAEKANAKTAIVDPTKFVIYDKNFCAIPEEMVANFNDKFENLLESAKSNAMQSSADISLAEALSDLIKKENLSENEQALFETKMRYFEGYIGAGCESLSARHWDQEEAWPGNNCFVIDTYQPIMNSLLQHCDIRLKSIVTDIKMLQDEIEVVCSDSIFHADIVLVTVPLGVLKNDSITFQPPLPERKQQAIHNLGMGVFNITALKFPTAFWPKEPHALFFTQFDELSIPVFFNLHHFTNEPIIVGYSGGDRARRLERMSDDELIDKVMTNFKLIYGNNVPMPESYVNTRWASDPYTFGSYSHIKVGGSGEDYDALASSVDHRLFFAGEATNSRFPTTTHGAYLSGLREAEKIIKILCS